MNKQELMAKYTKIIAKELYGIKDINVEFDDYLILGEVKVILGQYQNKKSLVYNGIIYTKDKLEADAWDTIIHELTHFKFLGHNDNFWNEFNKNMNLFEDLRKKFNKEVFGFEDFDKEYDENEYPDEDEIYCKMFKIGDDENESSYIFEG